MEIGNASLRPDALLLPFLQASQEREAQRCLERLVKEHAEPIIQGIVGRKWCVSFRRQGPRQSPEEVEAEDVCSEALTLVLTRLHAIKSTSTEEPISDFRGYVAVTTYRACDQRLRHKYPQRWSLKNRLRYLLTHQAGFALWQSGDDWLCGFAAWRDANRTRQESSRLQQLRESPRAFAQAALPPREDAARMNPAQVLASIFNRLGSPVEMDELVSAMAQIWGIHEIAIAQPTATDAQGREAASPYERVADTRASVADEAAERAYLHQIWSEIRLLPPRQCAALLLNLRDVQGRGIIALLPLRGVATLRQIAETIDMSAESFAALWHDLPLEDALIAEQLGITRQQVINLRKVARERLARRLRGYQEEK